MTTESLEMAHLHAIKEALQTKENRIFLSESRRDRPDLILYSPRFGFFSLEFKKYDEEIFDSGKRLAEKTRQLGIAFPELAKLKVHQVVLDPDCTNQSTIGAATLVVNSNEINGSNLEAAFSVNEVDQATAASVLLRLEPSFSFQGIVRRPQVDEGAPERMLLRLALDNKQIAIATRQVPDVLKVGGPPGSGKTLVLIARARWYASIHPDWNIQFVTYNKTLAGNLWSNFGDETNVKVSTFYDFSEARGHKPSRTEDEEKYFSLMSRNTIRDIDALFIDEYQDFKVSWLGYCLSCVKDGKGGTSLAGDPPQALYRETPPNDALRSHEVENLELAHPYRSTRQILEVASRIDPEFATTGIDLAPEGCPINLVYAGSWDFQADYIAWEISKMIANGSRKPIEIAVIATVWSAVNRLSERLSSFGIKSSIVGGRAGFEAPQWGTVTLTSVHSAKGYEFDAVFLMAVEALPGKDGNADSTIHRRSAYVGPTRARDELFITYTRRNDIIDKLHNAPPELVNAWTWPDDFEVKQ
jgi:superfamily I DNA/RNA helicase